MDGNNIYDIIIIGTGPAGLTAALYARRAAKSVLLLEKASFGGQVTFSPKIENYPGFAEISGNALADALVEQVLAQGAEIELAEALGIYDEGEAKRVDTDSGAFLARAVIIATGARHRMLGLDREEELTGEGVSYCAVCDGAFYKGKRCAIVGGGNSALQEAILLSDGVSHLTVIQNLDFFTGETRLVDILRAKPNVDIILGSIVTELHGGSSLEAVSIRKVSTGEESVLPLDGLFIAIGLMPDNKCFADAVKLDSLGYIASGDDCLTGQKGIFAAGDCRAKSVRQITTAAADGTIAALAAIHYIDGNFSK